MRYLDAYKYILKSPNWMMNILIGLASGFVPIAGPMVFTGYLLESMEKMLRTGDEKPRDFDVNRLAAYLVRGLWPFLVMMVVSIPFTVLLTCCGGVSVLAGFALGGGAGIVLGYLLAFFGILVGSFLVSLVSLPMRIRAGFTLNFGSAFELAFVKDFFRRVGKEVVLVELFIVGSSLVLTIAGLLACCVGIYVVMPVVQFAACHLTYQLLKRYEERGGMPIPFKPYHSGRRYEDDRYEDDRYEDEAPPPPREEGPPAPPDERISPAP